MSSKEFYDKAKRCCKFINTYQGTLVVLFFCGTIVALVYFLTFRQSTTNTQTPGGQSSLSNEASALKTADNLQNCQEKPDGTFPNIDFSLLGYNIFKGFPRSFGYDPGFTFHIFKSTFSGKQSADCRYGIPDGFVILTDIACATSFNSKVIETSYEFYRSFSSLINIGFGFLSIFGFKASAGYREAISIISSGENVFILSSAECQYYFSKLDRYSPPKFSQNFLFWVDKLNKSNDTDVYMNFFDYVGTHFPTQITYGAEYTYEYTMSAESYRSERQSGTNVAAAAEYAARYQASGSFGLDVNEKEIVTKFTKLVSTRTITKGAAPPATGDAMLWASTVKDNPAPVKYNLAFIADLFTERFMPSLGVNLHIISENLKRFYPDYCGTLQLKGLLDSCTDDSGQLSFMSTRLWVDSTNKPVELLTQCISECIQLTNCSAITFWKGRGNSNLLDFTCHLFTQFSAKATRDKEWETIFFKTNTGSDYTNQTKTFRLDNAAINGPTRNTIYSLATTIKECSNRCSKDEYCTAFSFNSEQTIDCKLYAGNRINHFYEETGTTSYVILNRISKYDG